MNKKFLITILIITFSLAVVKVIFASLFSTSGVELSMVNQEIIDFQNKNQRLEEEVSQKASLTNLLPKAVELGFAEKGKIVYLTTQASVALR